MEEIHTWIAAIKTINLLRVAAAPPAPPGVSRNHRVVTFVNDAEFERLTELARQDNATLSMTAYKLLTRGLTTE